MSGNDLEKMTTNLLGDEKGTVPTSIKGLAIALDQFFARQEESNRERHDEIMNTVAGIKVNVNQDCINCRRNYDRKFEDVEENFKVVEQKFDKLKYVTFFMENPKSAVLMIIGITVVLIMGVGNIFEKAINIIK